MSEKHHGDGVEDHLVGNLPHGGGGSGSFQRIRLLGGVATGGVLAELKWT